MTIYSFAQLEQLWINNGGSPSQAPLMAAIALAESSGNPASTNPNDNNGRQTSWGLWQLSNGTHSMPVANILDPNVNAQQAVKKAKSQGLSAWGTYTSGAYRKYMSNAAPSPSGVPTGSTTTGTANAQDASVTGDIGSAIGKGFANAISALFQPFVNLLIWGTETLLGMALIIGGVLIMLGQTQGGKEAEVDAATALVPEASAESSVVAEGAL
jgi:hypothetical protein